MRQVILVLMIIATMMFAAATPALAGSLLLGRETNPPPTNPPDVLEKVCISTTVHGDAVTNASVSGLQTFSSENCI